MKFAIFLQHYFPYGGLQRDALRLAEAAIDADDAPTLIVSTWDGPKPANIPVIELNSGGQSNHSKAKRFEEDCQPFINSNEYDSAICFSRVANTPYHFCGDPCFRDRFLKNKPAIAKLLPRYRYLLAVEQAVFGENSPTHIFFLAESEIPAYKQHYKLPTEQWTLLPPWLKPPSHFTQSRDQLKDQLTQELKIPSNSTLLLFVGSDFHRKGLDRAIQALATCNNESIHLIACGLDSPTSCEKLAQSLNISSQLHILGPRDDVPKLMTVADLLIHPARQETAGMVLLEALTYGLPVLCSEQCGYATFVQEAGCPLISSEANATNIAQLIQSTLARRSELSQKSLSWSQAPDRYCTAQQILKMLRK